MGSALPRPFRLLRRRRDLPRKAPSGEEHLFELQVRIALEVKKTEPSLAAKRLRLDGQQRGDQDRGHFFVMLRGVLLQLAKSRLNAARLAVDSHLAKQG